VDGARTPAKTSVIAPCRSMSMSSIESAPAAIPATRQPTFRSAFAAPGPATVTCLLARAGKPARSASAITGTSPARDTRFGSSNRADVFNGS
jgi:hypothetical protein